MNILLWILQGVTALVYAASGIMKVFMFEKISTQDRSFGALPKNVWAALGLIELVCTLGLILPGLLHRLPLLTAVAAAVLAVESLVFIWVHTRFKDRGPIVLSATLGLVMAFIAYGRLVLRPLS